MAKKLRFLAIMAALLVLLSLDSAGPVAAAPGDLDLSFGLDGKVLTDFGGLEVGNAVAIQTDGKIVVAGSRDFLFNQDFAVVRYNSDGNLDNSFGSGGKVITGFGGTELARAVAIQTDGKIVVAGHNGVDFALARYNSDGTLDTSFSEDGKVLTDFGGLEFGNAVAIQTDGKIVAAGTKTGFLLSDFALARYQNPPASVGGTASFVVDGDGASAGGIATFAGAGAGAGAFAILAASGWYVRRRWIGRRS